MASVHRVLLAHENAIMLAAFPESNARVCRQVHLLLQMRSTRSSGIAQKARYTGAFTHAVLFEFWEEIAHAVCQAHPRVRLRARAARG